MCIKMIFFLLLPLIGVITSNPIDPVIGPYCPDGFKVLNKDTCIKYFKTRLFYKDALASCKNYTGGHLLSIHNEKDNEFVVQEALAHGETMPFWTGLTCQTNSWGLCKWEDETGYSSSYNNFRHGHPAIRFGHNVVIPVKRYRGEWASADGTIERAAYFCEIPTDNATEFCPNEYKGYCYTMEMDALNRDKSEDYCVNRRRDLTSIHSEEENNHIFDMFPHTSTADQFRIGAALSSSMRMGWIDGSVFNFSRFGDGGYMRGACGAVSLYDNLVKAREWLTSPCELEMPFACKWAKNITWH